MHKRNLYNEGNTYPKVSKRPRNEAKPLFFPPAVCSSTDRFFQSEAVTTCPEYCSPQSPGVAIDLIRNTAHRAGITLEQLAAALTSPDVIAQVLQEYKGVVSEQLETPRPCKLSALDDFDGELGKSGYLDEEKIHCSKFRHPGMSNDWKSAPLACVSPGKTTPDSTDPISPCPTRTPSRLDLSAKEVFDLREEASLQELPLPESPSYWEYFTADDLVGLPEQEAAVDMACLNEVLL